MRGWLAVAAAGGIATACSLGALDGFSDGTADGPEAGAEASSASSSGGSSSSGGGGGEDGGSDGATATPFCKTLAGTPTFCVDFDDGKLPFGVTTKSGNATVAIDAQGKDGTAGLTATVPANAPVSGTFACISTSIMGPRSGLTVEADLRIEKTGTNNFDLLNLFTGTNREIGVSVTSTVFQIEEERAIDGGIDLMTEASKPANGQYQHIRFVLTASDAASTAELFIDGVSAANHDVAATNVNGTLSFQIGDCNLVGATDWIVHFDNVVLTETK